jgi:hypothetical protein
MQSSEYHSALRAPCIQRIFLEVWKKGLGYSVSSKTWEIRERVEKEEKGDVPMMRV